MSELGHDANPPQRIPLAGWWQILKRVVKRTSDANLGLLAAGIAFYGLLSLFPGITAMVAVAGQLVSPDMLIGTSEDLSQILPGAAQEIIIGQLREVAGADESALSFAALLALGLALFSASRAVQNLIVGLNVVYGETETRGFVWRTALNLILTLGFILGALVSIGFVAVLPALATFLGGLPLAGDILFWLRWPMLFLAAATGIAVVYRFGPDRRHARWRWITPGAGLACFLWLAGSVGFSLYVQAFGSYNQTFGALAGVIILLTWLWLSAFVVLAGAVVDAEIEAQTRRDTPRDKPEQRGSWEDGKLDENPGPGI